MIFLHHSTYTMTTIDLDKKDSTTRNSSSVLALDVRERNWVLLAWWLVAVVLVLLLYLAITNGDEDATKHETFLGKCITGAAAIFCGPGMALLMGRFRVELD